MAKRRKPIQMEYRSISPRPYHARVSDAVHNPTKALERMVELGTLRGVRECYLDLWENSTHKISYQVVSNMTEVKVTALAGEPIEGLGWKVWRTVVEYGYFPRDKWTSLVYILKLNETGLYLVFVRTFEGGRSAKAYAERRALVAHVAKALRARANKPRPGDIVVSAAQLIQRAPGKGERAGEKISIAQPGLRD